MPRGAWIVPGMAPSTTRSSASRMSITSAWPRASSSATWSTDRFSMRLLAWATRSDAVFFSSAIDCLRSRALRRYQPDPGDGTRPGGRTPLRPVYAAVARPTGKHPERARRNVMPEAVIVATARSPIGRAFKGSLVDVRPDDLAARIVQAALAKVPELDPAAVEDLLLGCGLPGGEQGYNMGRVVAILAGLPDVPGCT